jgi:hypothetical protein
MPYPRPITLNTNRSAAQAPAMDNQAISYRDLLHPLTPEDFFDQYYGTKPVHIPGDAEKLARIFSWDELNRLLNMLRLWTGKSLKMALDGRNLQPEEFCYPGVTVEGYRAMRPDPHRVTELLRRGATVVLDSLETLSPGIAGVAGTLAVVAGGAPTCNAYCSWNEHKGFVAHYDIDDVWALHFEGRKTWRVYEGRFEHPMEIPGFQCESLTPEQREQAALYRVCSLGAKLVRRGGGWLLTTGAGRETLSADEAEVARWVLGRDCFNAATLAQTFDDHDAAALAPVVEKLIGAGLVQPL